MPVVQNEILVSFAVDSVRAEFLPWAMEFVKMGFTFVGTPGTAEYFCNHGVRTVLYYSYHTHSTILYKYHKYITVAGWVGNADAVRGA